MELNKAVKAIFFAIGMIGAYPAYALTTYTYTDSSEFGSTLYSGSFSVDTALADGSYHFLDTANQPAGFVENFFSTISFVDGRGVTRTPSISLFDITIQDGLVSLWDIRASTIYTAVSYGTGGRGSSPVYHDNSVIIYHDTNIPYLPGNGLTYQAIIPSGDYRTDYYSGMAYQEKLSSLNMGPGVWSVSTSAVPLPPSFVMFGAGLLVLLRRLSFQRQPLRR